MIISYDWIPNAKSTFTFVPEETHYKPIGCNFVDILLAVTLCYDNFRSSAVHCWYVQVV